MTILKGSIRDTASASPHEDRAAASSHERRPAVRDNPFITIQSWGKSSGMDGIVGQAKTRILFVDDHDDTREMIAICLTEFEVINAGTLAEGLLLAQTRRFDLYLLDNWLPDGMGIELCRKIRQFDLHTPIIFYSGAANERDKQEAFSAGAQVYMVKPESIEKLERVILETITVARISM